MDPQWLQWAKRIQAIARAGLTYTEGPFDRERYQALQAIAAEIMAAHSEADLPTIHNLLAGDLGYPTPKVDVRGVVFREEAILLVRELQDNGLWTLPGGWADVYDTPGQAVEREVYEETGYRVRAVRLLAVYDRDKWGHPPHPNHIYKLFFLCELLSGEPAASLETEGAAFFREDAIPPLSLGRTLPAQIARLFELHRHPEWPTDFD